jgi:hypothetical protein
MRVYQARDFPVIEPKLTPHQRKEAIVRKANGKAARETARCYNVHNSTISRLSQVEEKLSCVPISF